MWTILNDGQGHGKATSGNLYNHFNVYRNRFTIKLTSSENIVIRPMFEVLLALDYFFVVDDVIVNLQYVMALDHDLRVTFLLILF
jgi:hypothetical protein